MCHHIYIYISVFALISETLDLKIPAQRNTIDTTPKQRERRSEYLNKNVAQNEMKCVDNDFTSLPLKSHMHRDQTNNTVSCNQDNS